MKNWSTALAIFSIAFVSAISSARGGENPYSGKAYSATLTRWSLDKSVEEAGRIVGGSITLDFERDEAVLILSRRFYCPPTRVCLADSVPAPKVIRLPIRAVEADECGAIRTEAAQAGESIEIVDYSRSRCLYYHPVPETQVSHSLVDGRGNRSASALEAEALGELAD
jgi:hypothetical protein